MIEISLIGVGIFFGKVRLKDIGELIVVIEEIISIYVYDKYFEICINDIIVGLKNVKGDGYILEYEFSLFEIMVFVFEVVFYCIEICKFEIFFLKIVESIVKIC